MTEKLIKVSVPIEASLHDDAVKLAKEDRRSLGAYIAALVAAAVAKSKRKP